MPRVRRRLPARRHEELSPLVRVKLETGFWFPEVLDGETLPDEELADLWAEYGDEILASHIAEHPGTRPWAWWEFDAPEPRKRIKPGGPYSQYVRAAGDGVPANCDPAEFESEAEYLARHSLLTSKELE